ncbi:MAG: YdcF family protein [Planctomycetes bacterium]|nr:YdcF family protein [Planctomycetota bacterium]
MFPTRRADQASCALEAVTRGAALFLGTFSTINGLRGLLATATASALDVAPPASLDANIWWIDLRPLPSSVVAVAMIVIGAALAVWALRPDASRVLRIAVFVAAAVVSVVAARNGIHVLRLVARGSVDADPLPLSFVFAGAAAVVAWCAARRPTDDRRLRPVLVAAALCVGLFPLAQMVTFGRADYRRDADAIVVFGARTYADGRPSNALRDRVRTAVALWHEGRAPVLYLSGGPGDGSTHETQAMRRLALDCGVPGAAIVLDRDGVSSRATVLDAAGWLRDRGLRRVLAVSHAYHLPRVRLEFDRAGVSAFTVPAREERILAKLPWFAAREVAAWWGAWVRA